MQDARKEYEVQNSLLEDLKSAASRELMSRWDSEVNTWVASIVHGGGPPAGFGGGTGGGSSAVATPGPTPPATPRVISAVTDARSLRVRTQASNRTNWSVR